MISGHLTAIPVDWLCFFLLKTPKHHRHAPNNDVFVPRPEAWNASLGVTRQMRRTQKRRTDHHTWVYVLQPSEHNTVTSVSMTVLCDCTTSPNSLPLLHHRCLQSVSALHNRSSWSFLLLSPVVLLYSPTDCFVLLLRFSAHTATSGPQLVGGEDSQSFSV